MSIGATGFERSAAPRRSSWTRYAWRVLWAVLIVLGRLVPPAGYAARQSELPPEWFKYPPI